MPTPSPTFIEVKADDRRSRSYRGLLPAGQHFGSYPLGFLEGLSVKNPCVAQCSVPLFAIMVGGGPVAVGRISVFLGNDEGVQAD